MATQSPQLSDSVDFPSRINTTRVLFGAGMVGLIASGVGYFLNADQFFFSYLTSFTFYTSIALASLILVMIHHLTRSSWGLMIRRIPESFFSNIWIWALFFIPILLGMANLYSWSNAEYIADDPVILGKTAYLNTTFFVIRQLIYFSVWGWMGYKLHQISLQMDHTRDWGLSTYMRKISAPGILIFSLTIAFASFDWLMSLDAHWFSTMFGVYFFSMSIQALFPVIILIVFWMQRQGILENTITRSHIYDLGAWFYGFTVFYAYIAFSQFLLIYYANISEEVLWFYYRLEGGWEILAWSLIICRFAIPFVLLMNRDSKYNRSLLTFCSVLVLVVHFIELQWIVMPTLHSGYHLSWMDLTTMIGLGGIFMGLFFRTYTRNKLIPVNDPKLVDAIGKQYHQ